MYSRAELDEVDAQGVPLRDRVGSLTRVRPWWFAEDGADPDVLAAVRAGGVATCVTALAFVQRVAVPELWVPTDSRLHVRFSKRAKSQVGTSRRVVNCQGAGRALPTRTAVDSIPHALGCAANCLPDDYWIAICDSVLRFTDWTIPDLQAEMGVVSARVRGLMERCDPRAESGGESLVRVRLRALGFKVEVQPVIGHRNQRADLRIGHLLIECDSAHHDGDARRRDIRRDRQTLARGWLTIRIDNKEIMNTWSDVVGEIMDLHRRAAWKMHPRIAERPDLID